VDRASELGRGRVAAVRIEAALVEGDLVGRFESLRGEIEAGRLTERAPRGDEDGRERGDERDEKTVRLMIAPEPGDRQEVAQPTGP
jgi:hypothetical protein